MDLMNKCECGSPIYINVGESIQDGIFRWYVSYHCNNCGKNIEMDGKGIESIPKDIQSLIIDENGLWELKSANNKAKTKYLIKKLLGDYGSLDFCKEDSYCGTKNHVKWIKNKLIEKGIFENDIEIKKIKNEIKKDS